MRIRKPRLRVTKRGVKVQAPGVRLGKRVGINISKSGVSGSIRTGRGSYNTRRGFRLGGGRRGKSSQAGRKQGCLFVLATILALTVLMAVILA